MDENMNTVNETGLTEETGAVETAALSEADVKRLISEMISTKPNADDELARREGELEKRERELTRRENRATALETLSARGLPVELADAVNCESAEGCAESIDRVEKAFRKAVQMGIDERLRGEAPKAAVKEEGEVSDEMYYERKRGK